ncbi:DNA polymerase III subunit gamma/tau [Rhodohalobacter sp. SW132]|uniref:DNA polymerase III subunit gamma/tau n=1 Tax=Rhodohalobacter sp. SW132 TaxID=2293433 RepID=UPI000E22BFBC|nr:DNA polymerase III subunit gamma/tau [Rhodohalobacter sp. SW132]REL39266.1 DNA polymerase III subunit gamma/tau [Rhodohalobacter sp. SW132]
MPQNYRALTRTYRPQSFDDIVSQEHVSNTLKNAIKQDRISHAYMFCGPRGVGKTTMARVLARTINSIGSDVDGESLNQTLNVVEIDAASNNKVDDIHHLRESVRIPPQNGRYKVFIVDEVHMLSKAAFNALLKTLEEPPAHAIFIFATTEPHKVLPTILSRVQRFDFKRISVDEIVSRLRDICAKEGIDMDDESLHVIAKKADGALRDALGLMDQAIAFCGDSIRYDDLVEALNVVGSDQLFRFMEAVEKKNSDTGLQLVNDLIQGGVDIQEFLAALTEHLRNLYVALNSERMYLVDATAETKQRYRQTAEAFEAEDLMRMLHMVSEAQLKMRDVQQPRVHFEILLLKLIHMNRSRELNSLLEDLNRLKKNGGIPVAESSSPEIEEKTSEQAPSSPEKKSADEQSPAVQETNEENEFSADDDDDDTDEGKEIAAEAEHPSNGKDHSENRGEQSVSPQNENIDQKEEKTSALPADESKPQTRVRKNDDFDLVKPALGFAKGISSSQDQEEDESEVATATIEEEIPEPVELSEASDLEPYWKEFLGKLKDDAPQMLYYQMMRVQLKDLSGNRLTVTADSEFATNMVDENQELLSDLMKKTVGIRIRIQCVAERKSKNKETLSPYERFKELQRKDPHLKSVVELFGAELDY